MATSTISYILNIPVYQYNTGSADNGNTINKFYYTTKNEAKENLDFINTCYNKLILAVESNSNKYDVLSDNEIEKYDEFFDLPGYQIKPAFVEMHEKTLI